MNIIDLLQREQEKPEVPVLRSGDTVKVHVRVVEGTRERIQVFEGLIIAIGGKVGSDTSFTVRRITHGVGVERTFLVHSPRLDRIEVLRHGDVRRGKLFYLRDKVGKRARVRERREPIGGGATVIRRTEPAEVAPEPPVAPEASEAPPEAETPEAPTEAVTAGSGKADGPDA